MNIDLVSVGPVSSSDMLYFMVHDAVRFEEVLRPALASAWRQRGFAPCTTLCQELLPAVHSLAEKFRLGSEETLVAQAARGLPFNLASWRALAGEILFYGAEEVPDFQTAPETLNWLMEPQARSELSPHPAHSTPIQQAHFGSRDLVLGSFYRPEATGYNDAEDVTRLTDYLTSCDSDSWSADDLIGREDLHDREARTEELEFARQCLLALRGMYHRAAQKKHIIVCEMIDSHD